MKKPGEIPKRFFSSKGDILTDKSGGGSEGLRYFPFMMYISLCVGTLYHVSWGFGTNSLKLLEPFPPTLDLCSKIGNNVP